MICILTMMLSGCGMEEAGAGSAQAEDIPLLDPVNDSQAWEAAVRRTLYDAKVYSATVFPYTEEYSFPKDVILDRFAAYPGETVKKGSVLAYADNSALEEDIKKKEEQILQMEEAFEEYRREAVEALYEPQLQAEYLLGIVENLKKQKPEEYLPESGSTWGTNLPESGSTSGTNLPESGSTSGTGLPESGSVSGGDAAGGDREKNPEYLEWRELYLQYEGDYRILAHNNTIAQTQLEQRTELYELDHTYALKQLEKLKEELRKGILTSSMSGSVVAARDVGRGDYINEKDKVIAIGDPERKLLKSQYINKATAAKARDIYAMIDGRRLEIVYQPMDAEEYTRLSSLKETIYSTFELAEAAEDVSVGDFGVVVVINDLRENVLSVPRSAVHTDVSGTFVYVMEGEGSRAVSVTTGMSDGVYTEILEGIQEGDRVLASEAMKPGNGRYTVEKGSFHSSFQGSGYLVYPSSERMLNPITYGTVFFGEYTTALYEHVEKGDVIAKVRVQADEVALRRNTLRLERLQQRLAVLEQENKEENEKIIEARKKEIEELQELIREMEADYGTTQIRASRSGIVIGLRDYRSEDILAANAELVEIADENTCYVVLENTNRLLQYGNPVTVSYIGKDGLPGSTTGMAANLSQTGTGSGLQTEYSMILLPSQAVGNMAAGLPDRNGWIMRVSFQVEASIREMDQVLVVPREAVWEAGGQTYVLVEEDGVVSARSFIAGGYDASYYWVVDGLTEGMKLCLK
ncbi:MAG: hypothetical protein K2O06_15815 [Acetatifactor sp.]|nr:hypothetical protein [Acetatifactor sp.]